MPGLCLCVCECIGEEVVSLWRGGLEGWHEIYGAEVHALDPTEYRPIGLPCIRRLTGWFRGVGGGRA